MMRLVPVGSDVGLAVRIAVDALDGIAAARALPGLDGVALAVHDRIDADERSVSVRYLDGAGVLDHDAGRIGNLDRIVEEDAVPVSVDEDVVDSQAHGLVALDAVRDLVRRIALLLPTVRHPRRVAGRIVAFLVLKEENFAVLAVPENVMLLEVLYEKSIA